MGGTKIKKNEISDEPILATAENGEEQKSSKKAAKKVKIKHIGKKYANIAKMVDRTTNYSLSDSVELAKKTVFTKFTPSVEVHINLNTDPKNSAHNIRTTINLPHSTGKSITLVAFGSDTDKAEIEKAGAIVGSEELLEELGQGKIKVDGKLVALDSNKFKVLATSEWMPKLAKVAKVLGPKGLMPNPKSGTVTNNLSETLANFQGGMIEIKSQEGQPVVHVSVGKADKDAKELTENIVKLVSSLDQAKPANFKKTLIKSIFLSTTMGPSIKVDLASIQ